jgi:hypothetical protein
MQKKKIGMLVAKSVVSAFFCMGMLANCARTLSPTGGPIDSLPPVPTVMTPVDRTLFFDNKTIFIEFDEYVQLRDLSQIHIVQQPVYC